MLYGGFKDGKQCSGVPAVDGGKEGFIAVTKIIVKYGTFRTGAEVSTSHTTPTQ